MKEITIPMNELQNPEEFHRFIKDALELPDYYGNNLDALYDVLTTCHEQVEFWTQRTEWSYGKKIIQVIEDAAAENDRITLIVMEDSDTEI